MAVHTNTMDNFTANLQPTWVNAVVTYEQTHQYTSRLIINPDRVQPFVPMRELLTFQKFPQRDPS